MSLKQLEGEEAGNMLQGNWNAGEKEKENPRMNYGMSVGHMGHIFYREIEGAAADVWRGRRREGRREREIEGGEGEGKREKTNCDFTIHFGIELVIGCYHLVISCGRMKEQNRTDQNTPSEDQQHRPTIVQLPETCEAAKIDTFT